MERGGDGEDNTSRPPFVPATLARRLLALEGGDGPGADTAGAAARVYTRLRGRLIVFLGEIGFDALWARALVLAQRSLPSAGVSTPVADKAPQTIPPGLAAALRSRDVSEAHALVLAGFTSLIELLFTFIGEAVSIRLILQLWPGLLSDDTALPEWRVEP